MSRKPNRPRKTVSPQQIRLLRVVGFRYSAAREAWVHRIGGGRRGPVFREHEPFEDLSVVDTKIYEAMLAAKRPKVAPEDARFPLPRREVPVRRRLVKVEAKLHASEAPRTVMVDGAPPRRGVDPHKLGRRRPSNVVPIKSARTA